MFCQNCGAEIVSSGKFCTSCGAPIAQQDTIRTDKVEIKPENSTRFVPAKCTQCGAKLDVDPTMEAAVCKFCGTPFVVSKAINNYNLAIGGDLQVGNIERVENVTIVNKVEDSELIKIMAGNQSLKSFIGDFKEYEKQTQKELIPESVKKSIFSSARRPGTIEDINIEEYVKRMGRFIKEYNVPRDEASLIEFYAYCNEKAHEEIDESGKLGIYQEELQDVWLAKCKQIIETGKMLYPQNKAFKRFNPRIKLDASMLDSFISSTTPGDVIRAWE